MPKKSVKLSQTTEVVSKHNQAGNAPEAPKAGQNGHN